MKFGKYRSGAAVYRRVKISSSSTLDLVLSASIYYRTHTQVIISANCRVETIRSRGTPCRLSTGLCQTQTLMWLTLNATVRFRYVPHNGVSLRSSRL